MNDHAFLQAHSLLGKTGINYDRLDRGINNRVLCFFLKEPSAFAHPCL